MPASLYNNYIVKDERTFVYNTRYMNSISFNTKNIDEVISFLENSADKNLYRLGFCTNEYEVQDMYDSYMKMRYSDSQMNVMLIMTYKCNCACSYCFENIDKNLILANEVDISPTLNFIKNLVVRNNVKNLNIDFFGGEPLLHIDKITDTCKFFNNLDIRELNIKYLVITNGTLLTRSNVQKLSLNGIRNYQITIDGLKEIHDARRPLKNNVSSFETIIDNLRSIDDLGVGITIRINIDQQNIEDLPLVVNELREFSNVNFYLAPIVGCLDVSAKITLEKRVIVLKRAWKLIKEHSLPISIIPPVYAPCPYHSIESAFYIDMSGNIYTCGGFVGNTEKIEKVFDQKKAHYYKRLKNIPSDKCFKCSFFPICMGSCKFESEQLNASCQKFYLKEIYDEYFSNYAKQSQL